MGCENRRAASELMDWDGINSHSALDIDAERTDKEFMQHDCIIEYS